MSKFQDAEIIWCNADGCAVARGAIDGRARYVLLAEDGLVTVSDTIIGAANLMCGRSDEGIAELVALGQKNQSVDINPKKQRRYLFDDKVYQVGFEVSCLHADNDLEEMVDDIVVARDAECGDLIKNDPEQAECDAVSEAIDWIYSEYETACIWTSSNANVFMGLEYSGACIAEQAALARGVSTRAAQLEEQGTTADLEKVLGDLAHSAVREIRSHYESELLDRMCSALDGYPQKPSPAVEVADDIPQDPQGSPAVSEFESSARGADMYEKTERIYETPQVVLTEEISEGAYFTPIPSKFAEVIFEVHEKSGLLCHVEFLPRRDNGYPYSLWEAAEILTEELPELYPDGPASVPCCVVVSRVYPGDIFDLVRELESSSLPPESVEEGQVPSEEHVQVPSDPARTSERISDAQAALLRDMMERSYEGQAVFVMENEDGEQA